MKGADMHDVKVDEQLLETAKARGTAVRELEVSAERAFDTLVDGPSWSKWVAPVIRGVTWTSPQPFGKGTTRTVKLVAGVTVDEVFLAWEANRRMAFAVTAISVGWVHALTESYEVTPLPSGRCTLRWTFAVSFRGGLGKLEPLVGALLPVVQARLLKRFERVARAPRGE